MGHQGGFTRVLCSVLCVLWLLSCVSCASEAILMSGDAYLDAINALASEDFGLLTVWEKTDADTTLIRISDRLSLTMQMDSVTGYVKWAELCLTFDADIAELDYASFSYFFLIMLKAYDENITVTNINAIHNALEIETYTPGIDKSIGYGSSNYDYSVTEETARFSAEFILSEDS